MERDRKPLVSIVVPVYNAEKSLIVCLDSIIAQDYQSIEVILVDDGSQDASPDICAEYKVKYPEIITVVRQSNGGPSAARNRGIELSKGEYIAFVDSDDKVAPNMISTMIQKAEEEHSEMVICAYWKAAQDGQTERTYMLPEGLYVGDEQRKILNSLLNERPGDVPPYSWVRLTRKTFFDESKLRFSERLYRSEDYHFWVRVHSVIGKVYLLSQHPLYYYFENDSSVTHNHVNGYWSDVLYIYNDLKSRMTDDAEISDKLDVMLVKRSLIALNNATFCKNIQEAYREINQVIKDKELNNIIQVISTSDTAYFVKYRTLMRKGLKSIIVFKYLMRWVKNHK